MQLPEVVVIVHNRQTSSSLFTTITTSDIAFISAMNEETFTEMAQYVQSLGATVENLQMKIEKQKATATSQNLEETNSPGRREKERAPEFWGKRDMGLEAKHWVLTTRS